MAYMLTHVAHARAFSALWWHGAMGHLGHIAIVEKLVGYNIVYSYRIQYCIHYI